MTKFAVLGLVGVALCIASPASNAEGLGDALKGRIDGYSDKPSTSMQSSGIGGNSLTELFALGMSSSGTAGNAAGVITYCMKNNYLNADKAAEVKGQLLGKLGLGPKEEPKDEDYASGLSGMIQGSNGKSFNLENVKGKMKEKACDFVLDHAKSLL
jgi:hypothetical protein